MNKQWTEQDVLKLMEIMRNLDVQSLNTPVQSEMDRTQSEIGDFIMDNGPGPQEIVEQKDKIALLNKAVALLPPREQLIIQLRYGLKDGKYRTLEECGAEFGVTRERIRQIETKALHKLKWIIKCKYKLKQEDF